MIKFIRTFGIVTVILLTLGSTKYFGTKESNTSNMTNESDNKIPYQQIPNAPESYSAANVISRAIDGLGYRFHWATDGLTDKELDFDPGNGNKSPRELMDHFISLSEMVLNAVNNEPNIRPATEKNISFESAREEVLRNFEKASLKLRSMSDNDVANCKVIFMRGDKKSEFPLWNMINGPLSDALYHTGQIVSQRRSAGNPIHSGVNVFLGKTKE